MLIVNIRITILTAFSLLLLRSILLLILLQSTQNLLILFLQLHQIILHLLHIFRHLLSILLSHRIVHHLHNFLLRPPLQSIWVNHELNEVQIHLRIPQNITLLQSFLYFIYIILYILYIFIIFPYLVVVLLVNIALPSLDHRRKNQIRLKILVLKQTDMSQQLRRILPYRLMIEPLKKKLKYNIYI